MAKAKNLAILAGLAGLAYANRDKLFGSKDKDKGDARPARPESTETRDEEPRRKITDYMKKAPEDEKGSAQSDVLKAVTAPKTASNAQAGNQGVIPPKSSGKSAAARMTDNQNDVLANAGKKSKATAENDALANAGSKIPAATSMPVKPKPQLAKPGTGVGANIATIANPVTQDDIEFRRLRDARMAKKIGERNTSINAFKDAPMEDQIRQNMNSAGMKRGGMVKMASGGMTASRRGDGIASRGKTRGKIC